MILTKAIDGLLKTTGGHDPRYTLDAVHVTPSQLQVTNGHAFYVINHGSDTTGLPDSFLIPTELITRGKKIRGKDGILKVTIEDSRIFLRAQGQVVSSKLPEKEFPDIKKYVQPKIREIHR